MNSFAHLKSRPSLPPILALLAVIVAALITPPAHAQNNFGTLTTLHAFNGTDGSSPYGGLLRLSDGSLYGVTESYPQINNVYQGGSIYKIAPDGTFSTVHVLSQAEGIDSESSLVQANDGYLYGSGRLALDPYGATAFRLNPDGTVTTIHSFANNEAASIIGRLFQGSDGELYGTATAGGPNYGGTIFKLNLDGTGTTVLHEFTNMDGYGPEGGVIQATDGNFYGTSPDGGGSDGTTGPSGFSGGIFRYGPLGFEIVHRFDYTDGSYALAAPVQASDGNLYGTTTFGGPTGNGTTGNGTIYRYTLPDGTFTVLHTFNGSDGAGPRGSLIQGLDGALYGTTYGGGTGSNNHGTIFRITLDGQLTTLHEFTDADGNQAPSELTQGPDGTFYGTTSAGGNNEQGTVFAFVVNAPLPGVVQIDTENAYTVDENAGTITITVDRTGGFTGAVSVNYQTDDGSASRGIGHAIARHLASEGAHVLLTARDTSRLRALVDEVTQAGGRAECVALDLRLPESAARLVDAALEAAGRIDIVVNNAGATKRGEFLQLSDEDWADGYALKFFGAVRLIRAAWPHLKATGGSVVNIAGVGGRTPGAEFTIGGSVNAALLSLTKALADLGVSDGVQVNAINPGSVRTDRLQKRLEAAAGEHGGDLDAAAARMVREAGITRFGEPEDIAGLVAFIVGPQGRWLQGALIDMDGGQTKTL